MALRFKGTAKKSAAGENSKKARYVPKLIQYIL